MHVLAAFAHRMCILTVLAMQQTVLAHHHAILAHCVLTVLAHRVHSLSHLLYLYMRFFLKHFFLLS